jgi:hypothetical protein
MEQLAGRRSPHRTRYLLYKRKFLELWLVQNIEIQEQTWLGVRYFVSSVWIHIFVSEFHCKQGELETDSAVPHIV